MLEAKIDSEMSSNVGEEERDQIVILLITSILELIQAAMVCSKNECAALRGFAVALGCISSFCCLALLAVDWKYKKVLALISNFLAVWWAVGVLLCTFMKPFEETGNGYIACWVALMLSLNLSWVTYPKLDAMVCKCENGLEGPQQETMVIIAFISFIETYACVLKLYEYNDDNSIDPIHIKPVSY
jgi:hypothetical protein